MNSLTYSSVDMLEITGLKVKCRIGLHAWEQQIDQTLLIDLHIPIAIDPLNDTSPPLDYDALCQFIAEFLNARPFHLIETAAEHLALAIKETYSIPHIRLKISKPHAVKMAANIAIIIER